MFLYGFTDFFRDTSSIFLVRLRKDHHELFPSIPGHQVCLTELFRKNLP